MRFMESYLAGLHKRCSTLYCTHCWWEKEVGEYAKECQISIHHIEWINIYIFLKIVGCTQSKEAQKTLESAYKGSSKIRVVNIKLLRRKFGSLVIKDNDILEVFIIIFQDLVNVINAHYEALDENRIVEEVLRSLPKKFDTITINIEESKGLP